MEEDYGYSISAPPIEIYRSDGNTKVQLDDLAIEICGDNIYARACNISHILRFKGVWMPMPEGFLAYYTPTGYTIVWWGCYVAISVSDGYLRTVDYEHTHLDISPSGEVLGEEYDAPLRRFSPKIE